MKNTPCLWQNEERMKHCYYITLEISKPWRNSWKKCWRGKKRHWSRLPLVTAAGRILMTVFKDSLEKVDTRFYIREMIAKM